MMPMIATTISSSMSVKPFALRTFMRCPYQKETVDWLFVSTVT
jgi:hypothetical protein